MLNIVDQEKPLGKCKSRIFLKWKRQPQERGLNWNTANETGSVLVSDDVSINCEVQFVKQA